MRRASLTERVTRDDSREAVFVKTYLAGPPNIRYNGVQTILHLGWSSSYHAAGVMAHGYLKRPKVRAALAKHAAAAHTTAEKAIQATALRAYATVQDVMTYDQDGKVVLIPSTELSPAGAAIVGGVKQKRTVTTERDGTVTETTDLEVKLKDGDEARRDLLKFHGLLKESVHVEGEVLHVHVSAAADQLAARLLGGPRVVSPQRGPALPPAPTARANGDHGDAQSNGSSGAAL